MTQEHQSLSTEINEIHTKINKHSWLMDTKTLTKKGNYELYLTQHFLTIKKFIPHEADIRM